VHNPVQEGPSFLQPVTFQLLLKSDRKLLEKETRNK